MGEKSQGVYPLRQFFGGEIFLRMALNELESSDMEWEDATEEWEDSEPEEFLRLRYSGHDFAMDHLDMELLLLLNLYVRYVNCRVMYEKLNNYFEYYKKVLSVFESLPVARIDEKCVVRNESCSICLETFIMHEKVKSMPCAHTFHANCIKEWLQRKLNCPVCREEVR